MESLSAHRPRWSGYPRCLAMPRPRSQDYTVGIRRSLPTASFLSISQGPPFALEPLRHLYSTFALTLSTESGAAIFHAQAYIPTQPAQASQEAWFSHAHEDPGRQEGTFPPPRQGT